MIADLVLNNAKAYIEKKLVDCSLAIANSKICKIGKEANMPKAEQKVDLKNLLVLPGLIDVHVHLRDEGKSYKEDFYSGTASAAAGGITTVLDMPNNNPVTMSRKTLKNRMEIAEKNTLVNVGFFSEFPYELEEIADIIAEGAIAFKLFLVHQVGGLSIDDDQALQEAFRKVGEFKIPIAFHAEDNALVKQKENNFKLANRNDIEDFLKVHTEHVEIKTVKRLLKLSKQTSAHMHFCHVTTERGLLCIIDGKKTGMNISCETTPHHIMLSVEDLRRCGKLALTLPPLREKRQVEALWNGVVNGWVDVVGSDHAPHALEEKIVDSIWDVKSGIPGLETTLPLLLTLVKKSKMSIDQLVRLLSEKPAAIFNLKDRGGLKEGNYADLVVVDIKRKYKIDASEFFSKAKYSPFDGWNVEGKPVKTFVNGQLVMDEREIVAKSGKIIRRE